MMIFNETSPESGCVSHPGGENSKSGVTLGPGYDMGERSRDEIHNDLVNIGIDSKVAGQISTATHMKYQPAEQFAREHDIHSKAPLPPTPLTKDQQMQLLKYYLPSYEKILVRNVYVNLLQREYDALVSFTVNPGTSICAVTTAINQGRISDALNEIMNRVPSDPNSATRKGLIARRRHEVEFYLSGRFWG